MNDKWQELVEFLEGTSSYSLEDEMEDRGIEESTEFYDYLDQHLFQCDTCGWWCSTDENYDGNCRDCDQDANTFFCGECSQTLSTEYQQEEDLCTNCHDELNKTYCAICGDETEGVETCDECDNAEVDDWEEEEND